MPQPEAGDDHPMINDRIMMSDHVREMEQPTRNMESKKIMMTSRLCKRLNSQLICVLDEESLMKMILLMIRFGRCFRENVYYEFS